MSMCMYVGSWTSSSLLVTRLSPVPFRSLLSLRSPSGTRFTVPNPYHPYVRRLTSMALICRFSGAGFRVCILLWQEAAAIFHQSVVSFIVSVTLPPGIVPSRYSVAHQYFTNLQPPVDTTFLCAFCRFSVEGLY